MAVEKIECISELDGKMGKKERGEQAGARRAEQGRAGDRR
jgi:hypothetical protein